MKIQPGIVYRQLLPACMILALGSALPSPDQAGTKDGGIEWQSDHLSGHVLTGKIWDTTNGRFITPATLYDRLREADFVLLGEVHDNPDHHALQALVIQQLVARGRRPAIVFEMLERDQQGAIERTLAQSSRSADRLGKVTRMSARGWPWPLYRPLIENAMALGLPIAGADLSGPTVDRIVAEDADVLRPERMRRLALDAPLAARDEEVMRADIVAAHCGYAPQARLDGMVAAQRARDATFTDTLLAQDDEGAVLIAGSGHVRNDFAVPAYLRRRAPGKSAASVAFTEVAAGQTSPGDYLPAAADDRAAFDYLWFTPGSQPGEACARFEESLHKLRQR